MSHLKDGRNSRPDIQEILSRMKNRFINEADSDNEEHPDDINSGMTNVIQNNIKVDVEKSPDDEIAELMLKLNGQVDEELVASIRSRKKMYETQTEADSTSLNTSNIKKEAVEPVVVKPRIILTLRPNENKPDSYVSSSNLTDYSTNSYLKKKKLDETSFETPPLKRSSRRSNDSNQSVLKSAIARKEKTFNMETNSKKKLVTKVKKEPTVEPADFTVSKIELSEETENLKDFNKKKNIFEPKKKKKKFFRGGRYNIFKKKSNPKDRKNNIKKNVSSHMSSDSAYFDNDTSETYSERHSMSVSSDFGTVSNDRTYQDEVDSSVLSNNDIEEKTLDFSQRLQDNNHLCLCYKNIEVIVVDEGKIICKAEDCVDGKIVTCMRLAFHLDNYGYMPMLRANVALPFLTLCAHHMKRFFLHHSCPRCGKFCSEGIFMMCKNKHFFHIGCHQKDKGCLHCGTIDVYDLELRKCIKIKKSKTKNKNYVSRMTIKVGHEKLTTDNCPPEIDLLEFSKYLQKLQKEMCDSSRTMYSIHGLYQACESNDVEMVLSILGAGGNPTYLFKDHQNRIALHAACIEGNLMLVHILLQVGSDPNHIDEKKKTPLRMAAKFGHFKVLELLLKKNGAPEIKDSQGMTSLHLAAKHGRLECCRLIVKKRPSMINWKDNGGWTPLVWACENSHIDVVKFFISCNPNTRISDDENNVALHWAAISGCLGVVRALVEYDTEVNMVNDAGDTALHIAARKSATDIVSFLLSQGAMAYHRNKSKKKPIDYCLPNTKCYNLLKNISIDQRKSVTAIKPLNVVKQETLDKVLVENNKVFIKKKPVVVSDDITHGCEEIPIRCVNEIDDEVPVDFTYIKENCYDVGNYVDSAMSHIASCNCEGACNTNACKCVQANGDCLYDENGRLNSEFDYFNPSVILYECNLRCKCHKQRCGNRVIQKGIKVKLELYRHVGMGWGVRTRQVIPRGTFVCEYVGEIITDQKANRLKEDSYLFNLENPGATELYCIDAFNYSNVSRFINHSCDPNLMSVRSFINHHDKRFPRIAFFAVQDISEFEPLSYDYGTAFWKVKSKFFTCQCGKANCSFSDEALKNFHIDSDTEEMEYDENKEHDLSDDIELSEDDFSSQDNELEDTCQKQLSEHSGLFINTSNFTKKKSNELNNTIIHKKLLGKSKIIFPDLTTKDSSSNVPEQFLKISDKLQNKFLESKLIQNKFQQAMTEKDFNQKPINGKSSPAIGKKVLITRQKLDSNSITKNRLSSINKVTPLTTNKIITTYVLRPQSQTKDISESIKVIPKEIILKSSDISVQNVVKIQSSAVDNKTANPIDESICEEYIENVKLELNEDLYGASEISEIDLSIINSDDTLLENNDNSCISGEEFNDMKSVIALESDSSYNQENLKNINQEDWTSRSSSLEL
ncbi:histone-lysine N-methyltransferase EHMT1 [Daktulosphaira vitifoliae]|uniref:histone-lysine N-methyltransferase EHMT1 n=1 Tax=Daktulosphaira vitifoliae TaxID=58002 RepID=UPI0021AA686A|nr:histone-lysine N-methyltransferase EHMT1 [Daktulosphaira vitifoliae]XP_050531921.1 histone-lysine N-methyltransferase EHMT1 [Daktulosphaira vitifoliae]XP_050531922.1 histone-lysine N-methyltransferase EHMT1 [Daktulosphaira vitifoliae]XP_050531924.1 histone-lysine N-methyltransferase EHMT1 [Daktulosphaira vitifoliae]